MNTETITLAGGCFWCLEAVFKRLKGVRNVRSGYSGGSAADADYYKVSNGKTGHAEAVEIDFDPLLISLERLLDVFWALHDPTTKDRQGNDKGPQYRSAIFYRNDGQKKIIDASLKKLEDSQLYPDPIVTEIVPFDAFYPAEAEHDNFYDRNRGNGYCRIIIDPKIDKLFKTFKENIASPETLEK